MEKYSTHDWYLTKSWQRYHVGRLTNVPLAHDWYWIRHMDRHLARGWSLSTDCWLIQWSTIDHTWPIYWPIYESRVPRVNLTRLSQCNPGECMAHRLHGNDDAPAFSQSHQSSPNPSRLLRLIKPAIEILTHNPDQGPILITSSWIQLNMGFTQVGWELPNIHVAPLVSNNTKADASIQKLMRLQTMSVNHCTLRIIKMSHYVHFRSHLGGALTMHPVDEVFCSCHHREGTCNP